jgi:hypothetical protein
MGIFGMAGEQHSPAILSLLATFPSFGRGLDRLDFAVGNPTFLDAEP